MSKSKVPSAQLSLWAEGDEEARLPNAQQQSDSATPATNKPEPEQPTERERALALLFEMGHLLCFSEHAVRNAATTEENWRTYWRGQPDRWITRQIERYRPEYDALTQKITSAPAPSADSPPGDIETMRTWLLTWGKQHGYPGFGFPFVYPPRNTDKDRRFGSVGNGLDGWKRDLCPPYTQRETYNGEFLVKAIEQVKRYDAGEKIPWFEFG
jgi:hypothetical protein